MMRLPEAGAFAIPGAGDHPGKRWRIDLEKGFVSIVDDNPCPNCRRLPTLMAGINVPGGKKEHLYIVCWTDNLAKRVAEGAQWTALHKPPDRIPWRQCSEYHLQTEINGEIIDYWPTRRKFQYRGKVAVGDVEAFIRRLQKHES